MKRLLTTIAALALALSLAGCAALKPIIRTVADVAKCLCELTAAEQPPELLDNQTVAEWCAHEENLRPFIDEVTAAKQAASRSAGLSREAGDGDSEPPD